MEEQEFLINRPKYIEQLLRWQEHSDLVKIITGVRRCGKSKLFLLYQQELKKNQKISDEQIININLEDIIQTRTIGLTYNSKNFLVGYNNLIDFILNKLVKNRTNFVFIDEIQLLENWQIVANTLRLQNNINLFLTGSNAYMFSKDLANSFGGRYVEIKIQPFSFKEYVDALKKKNINLTLEKIYDKYIKESGFPQTIKFNSDKELIYTYLIDTVFLNTIQKDIIKRFNISNSYKLDNVIKYIFDNIGNETSIRGIERGLKSNQQSITANTIDTYIQGLLDSYLVYKCNRYDIKGKKYLESNAKYYVADIGLRNALLGNKDRDYGHILENVVYLELIRRGFQVSIGKVNSKVIKNNGKSERKTIEVDFVAQKNSLTEYYQVALYTLEEETFRREITPLEEISDNYPKYILSMDAGSGETNGIKRLNVLDWLIEQ